MQIVAKFMLTQKTETDYGHGHSYFNFKFTPQYDPTVPEDQRFAQATPTGELSMQVDNPPVLEFLSKHLGKQFKLMLVPGDEDE